LFIGSKARSKKSPSCVAPAKLYTLFKVSNSVPDFFFIQLPDYPEIAVLPVVARSAGLFSLLS
jgi:hypothetical protein